MERRKRKRSGGGVVKVCFGSWNGKRGNFNLALLLAVMAIKKATGGFVGAFDGERSVGDRTCARDWPKTVADDLPGEEAIYGRVIGRESFALGFAGRRNRCKRGDWLARRSKLCQAARQNMSAWIG